MKLDRVIIRIQLDNLNTIRYTYNIGSDGQDLDH